MSLSILNIVYTNNSSLGKAREVSAKFSKLQLLYDTKRNILNGSVRVHDD